MMKRTVLREVDSSEFPPQPGDEISLIEILVALLNRWRIVVAIPLGLVLGVTLLTVVQGPTYVATATFMPQGAEGRPGGRAATLAQQMGVNLTPGDPAQSPEFYADLLTSRAILVETVQTEYVVSSQTDTEGESRGTLIGHFGIDEDPPKALRRALEDLRDNITTTVNSETGVVQLMVTAPHPLLAEQVAKRLLELLQLFDTEVRQTAAREESRFIHGRVEEARAQLRTAESALEEFLRANRDFGNSPQLSFEYERLERQVSIRQEVYASLLRSQEEAQIDAVRDTPMLTVIDDPEGTAEPGSRGLVTRGVLALVVGLGIAAIVALIAEFVQRRRNEDDPQFLELEDLVRHMWDDVRHPSRWIRGQG